MFRTMKKGNSIKGTPKSTLVKKTLGKQNNLDDISKGWDSILTKYSK